MTTSIPMMILALSATLGAAPLLAQSPADPVEQIAPEADAPIQQISTGSRQILSSTRTGTPAQQATAPQLSSSGDRRPGAPQLTTERPDARGAAQLYSGGRTAEASESLSRPSEGRTGAVTPVSGDDRCDPQSPQDARAAKVCAAVIETRSAEFSRPEAPQLSPEQRLLAEQRARSSAVARDGARLLAEGGFDPDSMEAQGVASLVLRDQAPAEDRTEKPVAEIDGLSEAAAALVTAIIGGAGQQPPPPKP